MGSALSWSQIPVSLLLSPSRVWWAEREVEPPLPARSWSWICRVAHPIEKDAVHAGSSQRIRGFPGRGTRAWRVPTIKRSHVLGIPFSFGIPRMAAGFVRAVVWKSCGLWEDRLWWELCCAVGSRLCFMGYSPPPGVLPTQLCLPTGGVSVHFSLHIPSDAVSDESVFTLR